jgi:hypothetical protein
MFIHWLVALPRISLNRMPLLCLLCLCLAPMGLVGARMAMGCAFTSLGRLTGNDTRGLDCY